MSGPIENENLDALEKEVDALLSLTFAEAAARISGAPVAEIEKWIKEVEGETEAQNFHFIERGGEAVARQSKQERYFSVYDAAKIMDMPVAEIEKWIEYGYIRAVKGKGIPAGQIIGKAAALSLLRNDINREISEKTKKK